MQGIGVGYSSDLNPVCERKISFINQLYIELGLTPLFGWLNYTTRLSNNQQVQYRYHLIKKRVNQYSIKAYTQ
jgi:hypothetical protein